MEKIRKRFYFAYNEAERPDFSRIGLHNIRSLAEQRRRLVAGDNWDGTYNQGENIALLLDAATSVDLNDHGR